MYYILRNTYIVSVYLYLCSRSILVLQTDSTIAHRFARKHKHRVYGIWKSFVFKHEKRLERNNRVNNVLSSETVCLYTLSYYTQCIVYTQMRICLLPLRATTTKNWCERNENIKYSTHTQTVLNWIHKLLRYDLMRSWQTKWKFCQQIIIINHK